MKTKLSYKFDPQMSQMWPKYNVSSSTDEINHPKHYTIGGIEAIEYMKAKSTKEEFIGHLRLTAIKYLSRAGHKEDALKDFKKGLWYIQRLVQELETNK